MTVIESQSDKKEKILIGLKKAYANLLEFKKQKNSDLIVLRDNKIVRIKPENV